MEAVEVMTLWSVFIQIITYVITTVAHVNMSKLIEHTQCNNHTTRLSWRARTGTICL